MFFGNVFSKVARTGNKVPSGLKRMAAREAVSASVPARSAMKYVSRPTSAQSFNTLESLGVTVPMVAQRTADIATTSATRLARGYADDVVGAARTVQRGVGDMVEAGGRALDRGVKAGRVSDYARTMAYEAPTRATGIKGASKAIFGGSAAAGAFYGVGQGLQELGQTGALGGVGGVAANVVGFGIKAMGARAGVGGVVRGAKAGTAGYAGAGGVKGVIASGAKKLESGYQKFAYDMPRQALLGGGKMGAGLVAGGMKAAIKAPVTVPYGLMKGTVDIGRAFVGGIGDIARNMRNPTAAMFAGGGKGRGFMGRLFSNDAKPGVMATARGLSKTMESPGFFRRQRPLYGAMAAGGLLGGSSVALRGAPGSMTAVPAGINPRNYGGGINYMNARGMKTNLSMGSTAVADRMAGMR